MVQGVGVRPVEVLVVGEALVDLRPDPAGRLVAHPGGSPANVAVAIARLGGRVRLATGLGDDEPGRLLRRHLGDAGVDVEVCALERTPTATVTLGPDGSAGYGFDLAVDLPEMDLPTGTGWLHVGSLAAVIPPAADKVMTLARRARGRVDISYDPNLRAAVGPVDRGRVAELVSLSRVVKLSEDDAALIDLDHTPEQLARSWLELGPELVVVTRGGAGAVALTRDRRVEVPAGDGACVIDTIGAGDAFTAGLVHGLNGRTSLEESLDDALTLAAWVARRTCERAGADPPILKGPAMRVVCLDGPLAGAQTAVTPGAREIVLHDQRGEQVRYRVDGLLSVFPGEIYAARAVDTAGA
jgi:fructokinase